MRNCKLARDSWSPRVIGLNHIVAHYVLFADVAQAEGGLLRYEDWCLKLGVRLPLSLPHHDRLGRI